MSKILVANMAEHIKDVYPKNRRNLIKEISTYIDKNSEILYDIGPIDRLYFTDENRSTIYKTVEMAPTQISKIIQQVEFVKPNWENANNPFFIACAMLIRHLYMIHKIPEMELVVLYFTLSIYTSKHKRSFIYIPNRNIMTYTVNNLSRKFKLKQFGNLFAALKDTALGNRGGHVKYIHDLVEGDDKGVIKYIEGLVTRIGMFVKNIAKEFYKNHKEGKYLNVEEDVYDRENRQLVDNISTVISNISDSAIINTLHKAPEEKFIRLSANLAQVSVSATRTAVYNIQNKKNKEIKEIYTLILQLFLEEGKNPVDAIGTKDFINFCYSVFAKSNTINPTVLRIKDILDEWLKLCSPNYIKTQRVATKSNFRKALFFYYVFMLQQSFLK